MPPATLRLLQPLIAVELDLDLADPDAVTRARPRLDPVTWAVLASEPLKRPTWFRTTRSAPNSVARAVVHVLDDLERVRSGAPLTAHTPDPVPLRIR